MNKGIWLSVHPSAKTAGCIHFWCVQMDLSTLSTGFSTGIVKKAPVFPRCFPLFPLSFPHFPVKHFIHDVLYRADLCENQGNYGPLHLFSERKSNPKIYFLQQAENPLVEFLPVGMKEAVVFHTHFLQKSTCGKQRENLSFQQTSQSPTATAPLIGEPRSVLACPTRKQQRLPPLTEVLQLKKRPRPFSCERFSTQVTSYSGTRSARSGSTGSDCRHPQWW